MLIGIAPTELIAVDNFFCYKFRSYGAKKR